MRNEKRQRQSRLPVFFCKTLCPRCNARCTVCGAVDGCAALCCHVRCRVMPLWPVHLSSEPFQEGPRTHLLSDTIKTEGPTCVGERWARASLPPHPPNVLCRGHMPGLDFILRPPCQWRPLVNTNWPADCDKDLALNIKTNQSINQSTTNSHFTFILSPKTL